MHALVMAAIAAVGGVSLATGWLGWQLLKQNGRLILRIEELEKQLDELEFGEHDKVSGPKSAGGSQNSELDQSPVPSAVTNGDERANRFGNRSPARSRIKRDGLKAGTLAPDFRLPRLDGRGDLTLSELRGQRVLLVFSDPHCGPCNTLAPELERFYQMYESRCSAALPNASNDPLTPSLSPSDGERANRPGEGGFPAVAVVMISRGEPKDLRVKVKEYGLTFPVVPQQQWEVSRRYAMFATPVAYLIDEHGVIWKDVAVGVELIQALMAEAMHWHQEPAVKIT